MFYSFSPHRVKNTSSILLPLTLRTFISQLNVKLAIFIINPLSFMEVNLTTNQEKPSFGTLN